MQHAQDDSGNDEPYVRVVCLLPQATYSLAQTLMARLELDFDNLVVQVIADSAAYYDIAC